MVANRDFVVEVLKKTGVVTDKYIDEAITYSEEHNRNLIDALVDLKYVTEIDVYKALAKYFDLEVVSVKNVEVDEDVLGLVTHEMALKYLMLPLSLEGDVLTVAISNPLDLEIVDNLKFLLKKEIHTVVASPTQLKLAIDACYTHEDVAKQKAVDDLMSRMEDEGVDLDGEITFLNADGEEESASEEAPIIKLVSYIITEAFHRNASDIHVEPLERKLRVRYRIDGVLREADSPPKKLQSAILSRLKIMSKLKISEKRLPQDGRIKLIIDKKNIDLRVSTIPTNHGESVVMRILDKSGLMLGLPQLGFLTEDEEAFKQLISLPNGILLITGPTGSGKTTTLYSSLNMLNRPDKKIITVEDPIEYQLQGINQVQVNEAIGFTFSAVLRSILRQDPNIIMIGEIRDVETAEIAINAALTGHLVFSTLHTNDAAGAFSRLADQGVKPFLVASSIQGVLAQRLVRSTCKVCGKEYTPEKTDYESIGITEDMLVGATFKRGEGCENCGGSGYKGRIGLFELIQSNDELKELIYKGAPSNLVKAKARSFGMKTLAEDGRIKSIKGMTSIAEVLRVTQMDED